MFKLKNNPWKNTGGPSHYYKLQIISKCTVRSWLLGKGRNLRRADEGASPPHHEPFKDKQAEFLTGSLPSMASSHSLLLGSERACSVMTPCLEGFQREKLLSVWSPCLGGPCTDLFTLARDHYKRTSATKIACAQMLDFQLWPRLARCMAFHSQKTATCASD